MRLVRASEPLEDVRCGQSGIPALQGAVVQCPFITRLPPHGNEQAGRTDGLRIFFVFADLASSLKGSFRLRLDLLDRCGSLFCTAGPLFSCVFDLCQTKRLTAEHADLHSGLTLALLCQGLPGGQADLQSRTLRRQAHERLFPKTVACRKRKSVGESVPTCAAENGCDQAGEARWNQSRQRRSGSPSLAKHSAGHSDHAAGASDLRSHSHVLGHSKASKPSSAHLSRLTETNEAISSHAEHRALQTRASLRHHVTIHSPNKASQNWSTSAAIPGALTSILTSSGSIPGRTTDPRASATAIGGREMPLSLYPPHADPHTREHRKNALTCGSLYSTKEPSELPTFPSIRLQRSLAPFEVHHLDARGGGGSHAAEALLSARRSQHAAPMSLTTHPPTLQSRQTLPRRH